MEARAPAGSLGARRARGALTAALRELGLRGHVVRSQRRWWLPYWEVRAKLVGWQVYQETIREPAGRFAPGAAAAPAESSSPPRVRRVEALVARDVASTLPASDVRGLGRIGISDRVDAHALRPFQPELAARDGRVCGVVLSRSTVLRRLQALHSSGLAPKGALGVRQRLSLIRVHTRLLYYPVWEIEAEAEGSPFWVALDGIDGRPLHGRVAAPVPSACGRWLAAGTVAGWLSVSHPALGPLALALWCVHRASRGGVAGGLPVFSRWCSEELDPRPRRFVPLDGGGRR